MRQVPLSPLSFDPQRVANVPEHPPPSTRLRSCAHIANRRLSRIIGARGRTLGAPILSQGTNQTKGRGSRAGFGASRSHRKRRIASIIVTMLAAPKRATNRRSPCPAARPQPSAASAESTASSRTAFSFRGAYVPPVSQAYLSRKLSRPLPTKDGGTLRTVLDARAYMLRLSKDRERSARWQRAAQLLLAKADVGAVSRQLELALAYDGKLDVRAMA